MPRGHGRTTIAALPLDVWAVVLTHVPYKELVRTFYRLRHASILPFTAAQKMSIFWQVVAQARDQAFEKEVARCGWRQEGEEQDATAARTLTFVGGQIAFPLLGEGGA